MDLQLPQLEWQGCTWRLPLRATSAAAMALALWDDPARAKQRLAALLKSDPALLLWSVCRAPDWHDTPPVAAEAVAHWFYHTAILDGLLDPTARTPEDDAGSRAGRSPVSLAGGESVVASPPHGADSQRWAIDALANASILFSQSGPPLDRDSLHQCPWFPRWLPVERIAAPACDHCGSADGVDAELAALLPRVIQLTRRLHQLETEFAAALEREKIAAMRELAYGASHEINNPLANIATRAQTLLREEPHPERRRKLATIAAQAYRAYDMIADMMLFAKPPALQRQAVEIGELVQKVIGEIRPDADAQSTQLVFDGPPGPVMASADPTQFGVAVKALLRNALEALATGGQVAVAVRTSGPDQAGVAWLELEVRDSGPGIPAEVRRHLFDPFYSGREAGRGLGFGLPKCWTIAHLHGGEVIVHSQPGCGATLIMRIPRGL